MFKEVPKLYALTLAGLGALISIDPALAAAQSTPAPIIGAGLPVLLVAGAAYGAYRLARRLRRRP